MCFFSFLSVVWALPAHGEVTPKTIERSWQNLPSPLPKDQSPAFTAWPEPCQPWHFCLSWSLEGCLAGLTSLTMCSSLLGCQDPRQEEKLAWSLDKAAGIFFHTDVQCSQTCKNYSRISLPSSLSEFMFMPNSLHMRQLSFRLPRSSYGILLSGKKMCFSRSSFMDIQKGKGLGRCSQDD